MTDAPKKVWLDWPNANRGEPVFDEPPERESQAGQTEYIRADIHAAEVARLRDMIERNTELEAANEALGPRLAAAEAERDRLREALKPLADRAALYDPPRGDDEEADWSCNAPRIKLKHLRAARAILDAKP